MRLLDYASGTGVGEFFFFFFFLFFFFLVAVFVCPCCLDGLGGWLGEGRGLSGESCDELWSVTDGLNSF